jgi:methyl-accepting chemotaxis protein
VKRVSALVAEIASASQEQSQGLAQVTTAITQMDQVVQQNASLVEEATAATESMKEQAGALVRSVSRFQIGHAAAMQGPAPEAAAVARVAPVAAAPQPIRFTPAATTPAAESARLGAAKAPARANGEWTEF